MLSTVNTLPVTFSRLPLQSPLMTHLPIPSPSGLLQRRLFRRRLPDPYQISRPETRRCLHGWWVRY